MKKFLFLVSCVAFLLSCEKRRPPQPSPPPPPPGQDPAMTYRDLQDTAIFFNKSAAFDLDGDGQRDIYCYTLLVGDPIAMQDKRQWYIQTGFFANLPVNAQEHIPILQNEELIPVNNFGGYSWYNASGVVLAQKVYSETSAPFWEGPWKDVSHRYVPIQLVKPSGLYNGWLEISFPSEQEKLVLHRAAVSKTPNVAVKAGK